VRVWIVQKGKQALDHVERVILLAQREKGARAATRLGWRRTGATNADGCVLAGRVRQNLLNADLVAPGDVEVVLVDEALARAKAEIGQAYLVWIVGEAHPTRVGNTVTLAVDHEAVEVRVGPAEGSLDAGVEVRDGGLTRDQESAPDQRADSVEPDAKLVDSGRVACGHTAPRSIETAGQGTVPG
jgi:hypothetical protein